MLETLQTDASHLFDEIYNCGNCRTHTKNSPKCIYDRGLLELSRGNTKEAFDIANELIEYTNQNPDDAFFKSSDLCLHLGLTFADALNYSKAIEYYSKAIERNPDNKQAYLERSIAYFETNQINQALEDFKRIDKELLTPPKSTEQIQFGKGFLVGAPQGLTDGFHELPSSLWYSLRGMGQLLWAGVSDPLAVPQKMIQATSQLIEYLKTQNLEQISEKLAPEIAELVKNWDGYDSLTRGQKSGYILGKYGVGVFISCGTAKVVTAYRELKNSNALCSLETMASSQAKKNTICDLSQKASENRIAGFAKVQYSVGKEGKHIEGHNNYDPNKNRSILVFPNPETLFKKLAEKGTQEGSILPGTAGYKEVVNCGEFIGFHVDKDTGARTPTSYCKIHYDQHGNGHMVPYLKKDT